MSKEAETISEAIAMLVEWNDRASAFIKCNRDYWDDGTDENDKEFDQVAISFDRADSTCSWRTKRRPRSDCASFSRTSRRRRHDRPSGAALAS